MKAGRQPLLNKELISEICKYVSNGLSNKDAIKIAGVGSTAFYEWLQQGRQDIEEGESNLKTELVKELAQARVKFKLYHLTNIAQAGKTDWRASAWALERMFPDEYGANKEMNNQEVEKVSQIKVELVDPNNSKKRLHDMEKQVMQELGKQEDTKNG